MSEFDKFWDERFTTDHMSNSRAEAIKETGRIIWHAAQSQQPRPAESEYVRCGNCKYRDHKKIDFEWAECSCEHVNNLVDTVDYRPSFHSEFGCKYFKNHTAESGKEEK